MDADIELIVFAITTPIYLYGGWFLLRWDFAHLSEEQKIRSWPISTLGTAVYLLGPIAFFFHFIMTRRGLMRLILPFSSTVIYFFLQAFLQQILTYFLEALYPF